MNFMKKFWKLFRYAGVEKEEYKKLLPAVYEENQQLLRVFSLIGAAFRRKYAFQQLCNRKCPDISGLRHYYAGYYADGFLCRTKVSGAGYGICICI